jgi:hypothetical protein
LIERWRGEYSTENPCSSLGNVSQRSFPHRFSPGRAPIRSPDCQPKTELNSGGITLHSWLRPVGEEE